MVEPTAFREELLNVLVCPSDQTNLIYSQDNQTLTCESCHHVYPIENGVPNFLK